MPPPPRQRVVPHFPSGIVERAKRVVYYEATINAFLLAVSFLAIHLKIATRRAFIVLQFCETSLFSMTVLIPKVLNKRVLLTAGCGS